MRIQWIGAALGALWVSATLSAQRAAPSRDATVVVRVESLGTEQALPGVQLWAGEKPLDSDRGFFFKPIDVERTYRQMEGVCEIAKTAANGEVELRVPSGMELFVIAACTSGDMRRLEPLAKGERRALTIQLWVGRWRYQGLVRERVSGAPVAEARIEGVDYDMRVGDLTRTDAAGRFQLESDSPLEAARITAAGFGLTLGTLDFGHANPERPLVFWLDRAAKLRGRVLELDGRPVAGTPVRCSVDPFHLLQPEPMPEPFLTGAPEGPVSWQATTDADGRFELGELPSRAWVLLELPDQRPPWAERYTLAPGVERELVLAPNARVTLSGVVLDQDGKPAAGLQLRARRLGLEGWVALRPTESDGSFRITGLVPGTWFVGPAPNSEDLGFACAERRVDLPADVQGLTLRLERGLFLRGHVLGGEELWRRRGIGARVEVRSSVGVFVSAGEAGEEGRFSIGPLAEGTYVVRASLNGFFPAEGVDTRAGASDLELHVPLAAGSIAVGVKEGPNVRPRTLLFPHGRPDLARAENFGIHIHASTFEGLEAGLYDAVLTAEDRRLGRVENIAPTPEETYVRGDLQPCATLRFVFAGPELHARVIARQGEVVYASALATQGAACGLFVPPGRIRLEVFPMKSWDAVPSGTPLVRELIAELGQEPEVLVP